MSTLSRQSTRATSAQEDSSATVVVASALIAAGVTLAYKSSRGRGRRAVSGLPKGFADVRGSDEPEHTNEVVTKGEDVKEESEEVLEGNTEKVHEVILNKHNTDAEADLSDELVVEKPAKNCPLPGQQGDSEGHLV